jgi:hypothetical protein
MVIRVYERNIIENLTKYIENNKNKNYSIVFKDLNLKFEYNNNYFLVIGNNNRVFEKISYTHMIDILKHNDIGFLTKNLTFNKSIFDNKFEIVYNY